MLSEKEKQYIQDVGVALSKKLVSFKDDEIPTMKDIYVLNCLEELMRPVMMYTAVIGPDKVYEILHELAEHYKIIWVLPDEAKH